MSEEIYKNLKILCVEDEDGVRKRIVNTLSYYFGSVLEAKDGEEGLAQYYEYQPDIILTDVQMPKMNGIELVKKIRNDDIITPIIILTAYSSEEYLMELINLHVQHFILKPVNSERLLKGINEAFHGKYSGVVKLCKDILLDITNNILQIEQKSINLSKREAIFLSLLLTHKGQSVYYSQIEDELWKDKSMSQDALKSFVRDLRKKLPFNMFENVSQLGYRLNCEKK